MRGPHNERAAEAVRSVREVHLQVATHQWRAVALLRPVPLYDSAEGDMSQDISDLPEMLSEPPPTEKLCELMRGVSVLEAKDLCLDPSKARTIVQVVADLEAANAELLAGLKQAAWLLADISPDGLVRKRIDALIAKHERPIVVEQLIFDVESKLVQTVADALANCRIGSSYQEQAVAALQASGFKGLFELLDAARRQMFSATAFAENASANLRSDKA